MDRETNSIGGIFGTTAEAKRAGTGTTLDGFNAELIYAVFGTMARAGTGATLDGFNAELIYAISGT